MATLYRKYRPQTFADAFGQNQIKLTLEQEIKSGRMAHAYMFCGPRAVGKTTFARLISKAVNCENRKEGESEPCNICSSCLDIMAGRSMDIIEIDAASQTGVDNVRENIISSARVSPSKSKNKVFIIDEVHMLSMAAFNALLKTLEEPPANVIFVLCTTEIHKVPNTIISRCQRFDFKKISVSEITKKLSFIAKRENIQIDKKILESMARNSGGHMRDAESLLGQIIAIADKTSDKKTTVITQEEADLVIPRSDLEQVVSLLDMLQKKDSASGIRLINNLIDEGVDLKIFLNDFIEIARKALLSKINPALSEKLGVELGETLEIKINHLAAELKISNLTAIIEKFNDAKNRMKDNFIFQLPVELAIIEYCLSTFSEAINPSVLKQATTQTAFNANVKPENTTENKIDKPVVDINLQIIKSKWNEVLAKIKSHNHSLSLILRVCEPRNINNQIMEIAFKYKFHVDRVKEPNMKVLIENILTEVFGSIIRIAPLLDPNLVNEDNNHNGIVHETVKNSGEKPKENGEGNKMIDNLLKTFGGRIVE